MFVLIPPSLDAAECTEQEAIESETTAAYIKSWQELKAHYHKYGHCDDGAIAEGYSESVSYLMETKWPEFLDYEMDKSFFSFVKGHVDEPRGLSVMPSLILPIINKGPVTINNYSHLSPIPFICVRLQADYFLLLVQKK
jgi:hypothetical protein